VKSNGWPAIWFQVCSWFWFLTHVLLLKAGHPFADARFDFMLRFHDEVSCISTKNGPLIGPEGSMIALKIQKSS
jgi:hypothetical protein